jgi:adenosyl cobinamide kinase/adenosyl cobinamide phosphate guanylyltransferase
VPLTVLLGGARSGKSRFAVELARSLEAPVTFLATGEARDAEMAGRIDRHRAERPGEWETIEEPYALGAALERVDPARTLVLDCLSLWVANALERGDEPEVVLENAARAARTAAARAGATIAVSNEVGLGVVPATPLGRLFRDLLGSVNRAWVEESADAVLVVAGRGLRLAATEALLPHEAGAP